MKTKTTARMLVVGDRFYKATDRNKTVYQIVQGKPSEDKRKPDTILYKLGDEKYPTEIHPNTQVVFLRNAAN